MRRTSFEDMNCSIAQCLEVVGEWWTLLIVRDALMGVTRFDDFRERLGIARNVLTQRLEHLVAHDIMAKVAYQEHPVRYDYRLTPKGRSLWLVLTAMRQWGDEWAAPDGPPVQSLHKTCGHVTVLEPVCSACGERVHGRDLRPVDGPGVRDASMIPVVR
ncbi:helix-turn-helix domain-containing protein [Nocardia sp. NPDC051463]|uniref:winged helix-turn-helix transcriptional regulator n=1 Tax=Nocardia sp. NPDC051463 TaxID=3154845 RepID=UPI0034252E0F